VENTLKKESPSRIPQIPPPIDLAYKDYEPLALRLLFALVALSPLPASALIDADEDGMSDL
jgi:hypothetical protein